MKNIISEYGMVIIQVIGSICFFIIFWNLFNVVFDSLIFDCVRNIIGG